MKLDFSVMTQTSVKRRGPRGRRGHAVLAWISAYPDLSPFLRSMGTKREAGSGNADLCPTPSPGCPFELCNADPNTNAVVPAVPDRPPNEIDSTKEVKGHK